MIDPIILFFIFGFLASLFRSDLKIPPAIYDLLSILLLITIGMKGGVELAKQPFISLLPQIGVVLLIGFVIPLVLSPVLRQLGKFKREDAASIAAHYGSVSVGTFAVAIAFMENNSIEYEAHLPVFVVMLEIPAIIVGILLAKGIQANMAWGKISHEIFLGKGVVLLIGGLAIGWIAGPDGITKIKPLFFDLFTGILALFLLEMGLITARQLSSLKNYGFFLVGFGIIVPVLMAIGGVWVGLAMGLSVGGATVLGTLTASASYIAVPAAMRISVPSANPTLSLTASLGITFPFNVLVGIPIYYQIAKLMQG
ncbi:sodium-dependent bicarbonate transport family permease [Teredinibacter waterburyi]|uniref:sodium-dependent bicarbonate transport family permease n=1 Tax=Teredinibacter waterburyi TaxID=1500538 RepID=UPI00165F779D|nr:sodium-dependent bicarbonate transport family permease [Teredinibacter waterburyi]